MDVLNWIGINWMVQKWNHNPSFHRKLLITTIYGFYAVLIFTVIIIVTGKSSELKGESEIVIGSMPSIRDRVHRNENFVEINLV